LEIRAANATALPQPGTRNTTEGSLCQQEFSATLGREQIQFQPSWYGIQPASFPLLERLVASANKCPGTRIEISGHTDPTGRLENNLALSKARAQEVANYLIAHGITAARLSVVGHGPNRPVADNSTPEGMQKNRRIDFNVIAP
jgi:OOP family OmpA-OmpF porin